MEDRLEKSLESGRFKMTLSTRQENLKELLKNRLRFSYEGGLFNITQELIGFIYATLERGNDQYIILDSIDTPIEIKSLRFFLNKIQSKYENAVKQYFQAYEKLKEARNIRKIIDWDEYE